MYDTEARLVSLLLDSGLLSRAQLRMAQERSLAMGETLPQALVTSGALGEDELRHATAHSLGIPFVAFDHRDLLLDTLRHIPEPVARRHNALVFRTDDDTLEVALLDMADLAPLETWLRAARKKILPRLTDRDSLRRGLHRYQKLLRDAFKEQLADVIPAVVAPLDFSPESLLYVANRLTTGQLLDGLLQHALYSGASAVHLDTTHTGFVVRYRIGGGVFDAMVLPAQVAVPVAMRLRMLSGQSLVSGLPQTGSFKVLQPAGALEGEDVLVVRMVSSPAVLGDSVALRLFREKSSTQGFTLESLGFHGQGLYALQHALHRGSGLILVGGREGSGKTTLLYTLLDLLSHEGKHIVSVEKSIAATLPSARQLVVRHEQGVTVAATVRSALLGDPDVLMIDSVEDGETAALAAAAANRGVLVMVSVDAADSASALEEMLELGVSPELLSSVFLASVGTALVRKLCSRHEPHKLSRSELNELDANARLATVLATLKEENKILPDVSWKDVPLFRAEPCDACQDGYVGHVGLQEVCQSSMQLRDALVRGDKDTLRLAVQGASALTLLEDALYKGALGQMSVEDILRVARRAGQ